MGVVRAAAVALVALALVALAGGRAHAQIERYALVVGDNLGEGDEERLRFASEDAQRVYDVLREVGGFRAENMVLLKDERAETVRRALISLNDRIRTQSAGGTPSELLVYYSGHADRTTLHMQRTTLETQEVAELVRGSSATLRILILDSCRSGGVTHVKGGKLAAAFPIAIDQKMPGDGLVFWSASAESESAQESDELRGSFFTHYLVSGLLGAADVDGDGNVSLGEAYQYAYENTLRASSRTLAGVQHPTFRYELGGEGEVLLSMLGRNGDRARLSFPAGKGYLLLHESPDGPVVAEVGVHDRTRRLSVKPGRYFVRGRGQDFLLEGTVSVAPSEERVIRDEDLDRIEYARLVRKGGTELGIAQSLQLGYSLHTPLWSGASICQGGFVGYAIDLRVLTLAPRVGFCRSTFDNAFLFAAAEELDFEVRATHAWDAGRFSLNVGFGVGGAWLRQDFSGAGQVPSRDAAAGHIGALGGVTVDLFHGLFAGIELDALTYFFSQQTMDGSSLQTPFALRISVLALGKRW